MIFNIFFVVYCVFSVRFTDSYVLYVNINDLNDKPTRTQNTDSNIVNKDLLNEITNLVEKQRDGITNVAIHKCLRDEITKQNKLRCIKNLVNKKNRSWYETKFNYIKDKSVTTETTGYTRSNEERSFDRSDFADDYIDFFSLRDGRRNSNNHILKKILRTNSNSASDSGDSDSEDYTRMKIKPKKLKRFKPKKLVRKDPYHYMQAPSRIYEMNLDRRRRLPHFLPKNHHWDEKDFKTLKNYWIHGPQGKYPGPYRIPF